MTFEHKVEQNSDEWFEKRIQYPMTASNGNTIKVAGAGLDTLVMERVIKKVFQNTEDSYTNKTLEQGHRREEQAKVLFEMETGLTVEECGFYTNDEISDIAGASPDGRVNEKEGVEIKSLEQKAYLKYFLSRKIDNKYMYQMQFQMMICGFEKVHFIVYNPDFEQPIIIQEVLRDEKMIDELKNGLEIAEDKYKNLLKEIKEKLKK